MYTDQELIDVLQHLEVMSEIPTPVEQAFTDAYQQHYGRSDIVVQRDDLRDIIHAMRTLYADSSILKALGCAMNNLPSKDTSKPLEN